MDAVTATAALNVGGRALPDARSLDRFIRFDRDTGVLVCEAGVVLVDILRLVVPAGWFLPAVPGTCYVTVGGALANDVHGKNHHRCRHFRVPRAAVRASEVGRYPAGMLSGGESRLVRRYCRRAGADRRHYVGGAAAATHPWPVRSTSRAAASAISPSSLRLCDEAERNREYTVAWIDCLSRGKRLGRGILQRANHAQEPFCRAACRRQKNNRAVSTSPVSLVNALSLRIFNTLHFHRQRGGLKRASEYFRLSFFRSMASSIGTGCTVRVGSTSTSAWCRPPLPTKRCPSCSKRSRAAAWARF